MKFLLAMIMAACLQVAAAAVNAAASDAFAVQRWTKADGLPGNRVVGLSRTENGHLLVSTPDGDVCFDGISFYSCGKTKQDKGLGEDRNDQSRSSFNVQRELCRLEETSGIVWAGTDGDGLLRIRQRRLTPETPKRDERGNVFFKDSSGRIWNAVEQEGVACLAPDGTRSTFGAAEGFLAKDISSFAETPDGDIWVGSNGMGLWRISGGVVARMYFSDDEECNYVQTLFCDSEGKLWVCSNGSIVTCINAGDSKSVSLERDGDSAAISFCEEPMGRIWLATGRKWLSFLTSDFSEYIDGIADNLQIDEFQSSAGMKSPCVVIGGKEESFVFDSDDEVSFSYASDSPGAADCVEFSSRLSPVEPDWVDVGKSRNRSFRQLVPGKYKFEVRARLPLGEWGKASAVEFTVDPVFYETIPFVAAVSLMAVVLFFAAVRGVYVYRLRKRLASIRQREMLSIERARIARDIHDDVGARLTRISMLISMAAERGGEISGIADEVRDVVLALDEVVWAVEPRNDTLSSFVDYVYNYAESFVSSSNLGIRVKLSPELPDAKLSSVVRHAVFMCIKEALNNTVKHASASHVFIAMEAIGDRVKIRIGDDGKGFDSLRKGGNGLLNMGARMKEIGGFFAVGPRSGGGTEVEFSFPIEKKWSMAWKKKQ
ncbi:MAG: hypothetical protein J6R18_00165 [Kiritimatiellae bacterium]|nr:hypothetical protein [Kiritimatiellia bacterium]